MLLFFFWPELWVDLRMALMNLFDLFDADGSGTLSQDEFSLYSLHTGDGPAGPEEWALILGPPSASNPWH